MTKSVPFSRSCLERSDLIAELWHLQDYEPLIRKEEALRAVEKNVAGSRPKELFEEALETADKQFEKDRGVLKDLMKEHNIAVELESTFEGFCAALDAHEAAKPITNPNK
jgi:hypothetical protein